MKLSNLLKDIAKTIVDVDVKGLSLDSRNMANANVFFALHGAKRHGIEYAELAIANGANAIVYDPAGIERLPEFATDIVVLAVAGLNQHLGVIAARFYNYPADKLAVIGITGTNGKTTCSQLIAQALPDCALIGTLGWGDSEHLVPTVNTTPDALAIQKILHGFVLQHKQAVAMEVSSHGLQQGRVNGVHFKGAVFTNITRDHLDYHQSMDEYLRAKLGLFTKPDLEFVVINLDDPKSDVVLAHVPDQVKCWTHSRSGRVWAGAENIIADHINYSQAGISFHITWRTETVKAFTPLVGSFNLENVLAVIGVLLAMDVPFSAAVARAAKFKAIAGRMEKFGGVNKPSVFVDYAHTPDALEKVLQVVKNQGQLWLVFGCGGNRDQGKRAEMGRIAAALADQVILTDDNPRHESPADIVKDILAGCQSAKTRVIHNRESAIRTAILAAAKTDSVVVAGKGHEQYQEINGEKLPFSDQDIVKQTLAAWESAA